MCTSYTVILIMNVEMRHSRNDTLDENKHIDCKITSKNTLCVLHTRYTVILIRNVKMLHSRNDILDENKHIDYKISSKNTLCVLHMQLF